MQEIQRVEENVLGFVDPVYKQLDYEYDLISGNVNFVHFQRGEADGFSHKYTYDGDNRITAVFTSKDEVIWNKEAGYDYYAHGPLARTVTGRDAINRCDYAYTIHGWLKGVESQNFAYSLGYYDDGTNKDYQSIGTNSLAATPMANSLYNGNISTMSTHTPVFAVHGMPTSFTKQFGYDQLNRIKSSQVLAGGNSFKTAYSYDKNGNLTNLDRYNKDGIQFDAMVYNYHNISEGYLRNTNQLRWVDDTADAGAHDDDIEDQSRDNYVYDENGNLVSDRQENIKSIEWCVTGKVHAIVREKDEGENTLYFSYDAMGNRISKKSIDDNGNTSVTYYFRDATGNVMAVYNKEGAESFGLKEQHIYGSERLGMYKPEKLSTTILDSRVSLNQHELGQRSYECKDHLGNVHLVLSDRKPFQDYDNTLAAYEYYPFGMLMQSYTSSSYRYGFQGQEKDDEIKGSGNSVNYKYRMHDPRLGRFFAVDPLIAKYPFYSSYAFSGNRVIDMVELEGLEPEKPKILDYTLTESTDQEDVYAYELGEVDRTDVNWGQYANDIEAGAGQVAFTTNLSVSLKDDKITVSIIGDYMNGHGDVITLISTAELYDVDNNLIAVQNLIKPPVEPEGAFEPKGWVGSTTFDLKPPKEIIGGYHVDIQTTAIVRTGHGSAELTTPGTLLLLSNKGKNSVEINSVNKTEQKNKFLNYQKNRHIIKKDNLQIDSGYGF